MDEPSKRNRSSKTSKPYRKSRGNPSSASGSASTSGHFSHLGLGSPIHSPSRATDNRLDDLIDTLTSEPDDASSVRSSQPLNRLSNNLVDPDSPPLNENHRLVFPLPTTLDQSSSSKTRPSRVKKKSNRFSNDRTYSRSNPDKISSVTHRRLSLGDERRLELTKCMEYCQGFLQSAQQFHNIYTNDNSITDEQRKKYPTALWYELKTYFHGLYTTDESGVKMEQHHLDQQRKRCLDEFYTKFTECDFERTHRAQSMPIERHHLCENHLNSCNDVDKSIGELFQKWDYILSLFPNHAALEQYDKRFDPATKEGRMFYEKLSVFQAWFNLNAEINRLLQVLGRIMACTQCQAWPNVSCSSTSRSNENVTNMTSRPPTPSSTLNADAKEMPLGSPSNSPYLLSQPLLKQQYSSVSSTSRVSHSSSFSTTPDTSMRRLPHIPSMASMDLNLMGMSTQPLTEFYFRYIDDQLTHGRVELMASIFRSKHGPLLQRLRYVLRKDQTSMSSISSNTLPSSFDTVFKYYPSILANSLPNETVTESETHRLMEEFLSLNKQLQELKNPNLLNKKKKNRNRTNPEHVVNILGRFDQNPTLTSSTFPPASAPTIVLRVLTHDRSVLKRQSYFLDYLDPTLYPHLPGSTLFPDPCTFLDKVTFTSYSPTTNEETVIISKMLAICYRLYDKPVWAETGKCSDMFELFHLPSLYPQYVFLVQIPLDLMFAWYKYHQDRRMDQTSTTGALLLLIDECKVLIHSATLIRQYIKIMTVDVFERSELNLIGNDLMHFDQNIIATMGDVMKYIEEYVKISLQSNLFHNCIILLRDQWKSLKRYATMMNIEETLGDRFLRMCSKVIERFHEYLDVTHTANNASDIDRADSIKKKIQRKYQKKLAMDILREVKGIYEDCALTVNIYLQKAVCRRFLLILKTAGFERIKLEDSYPTNMTANKETSTCLLFAPTEYFENQASKLQLARTLSSSFRISTNLVPSGESSEEQAGPTGATQQNSPPSVVQPAKVTIDATPPSVYILCVPISSELEGEWRGVTHTVSITKSLSASLPLYTSWKTNTIFLLSQSTNLEKFEESFRDRLSKTNVQQNDLYNFDAKPRETVQRRSCFEKVDRAMNTLAHAILNLTHHVINNVEKFEEMIRELETRNKSANDGTQRSKIDTRSYIHTEEIAFGFAMDLIRETSYYATQLDDSSLKNQAELQLSFANTWLNFVQQKKTINNTLKYSHTLPMWLLPGVHFLRHICSLPFTTIADDSVFDQFYNNMQKIIHHLYNSKEDSNRKASARNSVLSKKPSKPSQVSKATRTAQSGKTKKKRRLTRIEKLELLDKSIDRRRFEEELIGEIKHNDQGPIRMPNISRQMKEDLAVLRIRKFHKLNLLSRGKFATTYKCTVEPNEVLCYKQYKIQHNDGQAIAKVLEQLVPLIHINHENLIKYRGIALEYDHILFFMEYCSHGTIAQLLLGTSPSHADNRRTPSSVVCSIVDTSSVDKGIIQTPAGYAFFQEFLARRYLKQLLSALSCLHKSDIIHRDIRNVNIFLTDSTKQSIKLGDVNFVYDFKFMQKQSSLIDMEELDKVRESIVFYAPETITQNETTTKSDIWSLGCALVHMLTGRIPLSNPSIASSAYYLKVVNWIANGFQPTIPTDFSLSKKCTDFLEECFRHDPNLRPSSDELLQHPFVVDED